MIRSLRCLATLLVHFRKAHQEEVLDARAAQLALVPLARLTRAQIAPLLVVWLRCGELRLQISFRVAQLALPFSPLHAVVEAAVS